LGAHSALQITKSNGAQRIFDSTIIQFGLEYWLTSKAKAAIHHVLPGSPGFWFRDEAWKEGFDDPKIAGGYWAVAKQRMEGVLHGSDWDDRTLQALSTNDLIIRGRAVGKAAFTGAYEEAIRLYPLSSDCGRGS
jgi:hypothetical protein